MRKVNMFNRSVFMGAVALTLLLVAFAAVPASADAAIFTSEAIPGDATAMVADCGRWCVKVWRVCVCL